MLEDWFALMGCGKTSGGGKSALERGDVAESHSVQKDETSGKSHSVQQEVTEDGTKNKNKKTRKPQVCDLALVSSCQPSCCFNSTKM